MSQTSGMVYNIQRFCLHDGAGIRTVVFFKGCQLRCVWCCNPESQEFMPQLMYNQVLCKRCGRCITACPNGALAAGATDIQVDRGRCVACGLCAQSCPWKALSISGKIMSAEEIMAVVRRDKSYYDISGGGVTFSGGEATAQGDFLLTLLRLCQAENLSVTLETCGLCEEALFEQIAGLCGAILFDIKHTDDDGHKKMTGAGNSLILRNLRRAAQITDTIARVPLITGFNDNAAFFDALAALLREIPVKALHLLPYHRLGSGKYNQLGRAYEAKDTLVPDGEQMKEVIRALSGRLSIPILLEG